MHTAISEVIARCDKDEALTLDDIVWFSASMNLTCEQFYEAVLMSVAEAFQRGDLTFSTGDAAANRLWTLSEFSLTGRARAVFEAFDEGEYHRTRDRSDDPVQLYTRPQIDAILRGEFGT